MRPTPFSLVLLSVSAVLANSQMDCHSKGDCSSAMETKQAANPVEAVEADVVVVGAGLSGLTVAYRVLQTDSTARVHVVEARGRVGGRVLNTPNGHDLGGAWCWKDVNPRLYALARSWACSRFGSLEMHLGCMM